VNACLQHQVKKLVHISSVAALGRQKGQQLVKEENKWIDNPANSVYSYSKYKAELEVFRGQEEGLNTVVLNPSVILAPADWNRSSARLFKYVWRKRPFYIDADLNFVDVRDVATCACLFLDHESHDQRFIVSGGSISFQNFFEKIAANFQIRAPFLKLSKNMLKVAAKAEMVRILLTRSEPVITAETAQLAHTHFVYDNKKIKKTLNFEFQTIDNTLEWCCEYYSKKFASKK
jgi:nucleoside-diphosphate-sugar epimerase